VEESRAQMGNSQESVEISLLDVLVVLAKHGKLIVAASLGTAVLVYAGSLLLQNTYTASATILPPQQNQSTAAVLLGQLSGLAGLTGGSMGIKNPNDLYVGMLKSRTIADRIIDRFGLQKMYDSDTMVEAREEFKSKSSFSTSKDGLITIEFDDHDPNRAAAIANALVAELDRLSQSLAVTEAAQRRHFFERQLKDAKEELSKAEVALKITQEQTGLIKLDDQGKAIIEAVATLRGHISAKEVELRSLNTFTTKTNPEYVRTQQQLAALKAELEKLERAQAFGRGNVLLPTGTVPAAGLEYIRKYREVKYQETMFELLAKQYEIAKLDEAKEVAVIQIVDPAIAPDEEAKPRRLLIAILGGLAAALASILWAFLAEARERLRRDPQQAAKLDMLGRLVRLRRL
jgi:tyrosine-protein kinase Etk/Wzc